MKCPLMSQPYESGEYQSKWHGIDCLKEECAWWQVGDEQCAVLNLTEGIADIAHWLGDIKADMPKWQQFGK